MHEVASQELQAAAAGSARSTVEATARLLRASAEPARSAFVARALDAVAQLAKELDTGELSDATGATSNYAVLLSALQRPGVVAALSESDPLAPARLRGVAARADILGSEGGTLSVEQVAEHLGITRQAVDKRRRAGRLLALSTGRRGYAYPAWQFARVGVLEGFEDVLEDLREEDPWAQAVYFLGGNTYLDGVSPLAALRARDFKGVRRAARSYGEQGAP